jgi:hypothetical protein
LFDTIIIYSKPVEIAPGILNQYDGNPFTFLYTDTGLIVSRYKITGDSKIPYIEYQDHTKKLKLQLSIPKFLYGNNVKLLKEGEISIFFNQLQQRMKQLFNITVPNKEWIIERIDVCWNFQVGEDVANYLCHFSRLNLPYKDTILYNANQTVSYKNKSSEILIYDKKKQCVEQKESNEITKLADGILRLEIRPSYHDIKKFSRQRRAVEILTKSFFDLCMQNVLNKLSYPVEANDIDVGWLLQNKNNISKIETYLGFEMLQKMIDESTLKQIYSNSTYNNRKSMAKKMTIPKRNCLKPLNIS